MAIWYLYVLESLHFNFRFHYTSAIGLVMSLVTISCSVGKGQLLLDLLMDFLEDMTVKLSEIGVVLNFYVIS